MAKPPLLAHILLPASLLAVMFIWGGSFIAIKVGLRYLTPYELVVARFVPSALLLFPLGLWSQSSRDGKAGFWRSLAPRQRVELLMLSILAVPAYHFCLNEGETLIPAGWASLIISVNPACIAILAAIVLSERIGATRLTGIGIAFLGLILVVTGRASGDATGGSIGVKGIGAVITLGAVVSWGGFTVGSKRMIGDRDPLAALGWIMILSLLWLAPGMRPDLIRKLTAAPAELWWAIAFLSLGCTVIGFAVWFKALEVWPASRAAAFIYLVPVFALFQGHLILGEDLGLRTILGALIVLGGVILAGRSSVGKANEGAS